jgi:DNA-binding MarR family transcriptional regulator
VVIDMTDTSDASNFDADTFDADDVARLRVALGRIARRLDRMVSPDGLTHSQLSVLGTVSRRGPLGIGELAEIEGLNPTMLSRVVGKLDEIGLISRRPDPDDGRAAKVHITPVGQEMHEALVNRRTEILATMLRQLPAGRSAELLSALPALEALMDEIAARSNAAAATR